MKSHRKLESAVGECDFLLIAGNLCADMAATAAYATIPLEIRVLSEDVVKHSEKEKHMLRNHLLLLGDLNVARCKIVEEKKHETDLSTFSS